MVKSISGFACNETPMEFCPRRMRARCAFVRIETVARKTQAFNEKRVSEKPPVTGLGNGDAAHVSEHTTISQAAGLARVALSRLSGLTLRRRACIKKGR
ncbi:hypothetical protein HYPGJ_30253 [Hyphomicrobium sp. GJ21]|nr:hypothetical protein HYPGJ_30253 [Hyphomicrobium sp. GJ21]